LEDKESVHINDEPLLMYNIGRGSFIKKIKYVSTSYQERWRDWPDDISATLFLKKETCYIQQAMCLGDKRRMNVYQSLFLFYRKRDFSF